MTVRAGGFIAAAAVLATLLAGCSTSDEDNARSALSEFLDEVGEQDYQEACGYLDKSAKQKLGADCTAALSNRYADLSATVRSDLDKIQVDRVTVKGSTATVTDRNIEVVQTVRTTKKDKNGKKKTTTSTSRQTAPDVSSGNGFTLVKSGDNWLVRDGL
ncbi:hypothetical protein [Cryptosporangium aurantiacum]|uniref:DUF4878 domain-containing protein n=1 Tax=Cryptosporangium aurantiacum TaxID=134849 RepID=A0A1M7RCI1_9ACTN|nr:hypothetical protein [Cryptosporangium aurantiacum]SHN43993.1 hypothetical protein SAMN05443668_1106 [Cryptosporangium aurantiacum]